MFTRVAFSVAITLSCILILLAAELAYPRDGLPSRHMRYRMILFSLLFVPFAAALVWALHRILGPLRFSPTFAVPGIAGLLIGAIVGDFFYYWLHRAQHTIPALWRLHSVHHSIERLGAGGAYHHVSEAPLKALFYVAPLSVVTTVPNVGLFGVLLAFHGNYIHSATRLNFGLFSRIVADNRFHRIHHSVEARHYDRNFAALFPFWDWIFGTAHFPSTEEWPLTGLVGRIEPRTVASYLLARVNPGRPSSDIAASGIGNADRVDV